MAIKWYKRTPVIVALIGAVSGIIGIVITVIYSKDKLKGLQTANNSPGAIIQKQENSPGSIQAAGNVIIHPGELPEAELKTQIRDILRKINPVILSKIDEGQSSIAVMINVGKLQTLLYLSNHPAFSKYLGLRGTGNQFRGINNGGTVQIGDNLNDVDQSGALDGYILVVGSPLRN